MHQLSMHRDSPFVRLYLWAWDADEGHIDTCRLFWGYLFMPVNLFLRVLFFPLWVLGDKVIEPWWTARQRRKQEAWLALPPEERHPPEPEKGPSLASRFFAWLSRIGGHIGTFFGQTVVLYIVLGLVSLTVAAALGIGIYLLIASGFWWKLLLGILAVCAGLIALGAVLWFFAEGPAQSHVQDFGKALKQGFRGVHEHTCAKVELREHSEDNEAPAQ